MKIAICGVAALLMGSTAVSAGGIERYNQGLAPLFEEGNYAEIGFGRVSPKVSGEDSTQFLGATPVYPGGVATGDVAGSYTQFGLAYKHQFTPALSGVIMLNQPFGADIYYPLATEGGTPLLGGTEAHVDSKHLTAVLRYKMPNNFAVHGGLNFSRASGEVTLNGLAYTNPVTGASVAGYHVDMGSDTAVGWLAGVSWEKPEIAARVALTYQSDIEHDFDTMETLTPTLAGGVPGGAPSGVPIPTGKTTVTTPKSWTLDFQTGVAADTLVFGSIRWVDWSSFKVAPPVYGAALGSLTELDDSTTFTLGVGRKFNENWSGLVSVDYEKSGNDLVSPLAPTNGRKGITLAAIYRQDNMKVTAGINYTRVGNARPETGTPDTERAYMSGNSAVGVGIRVGYSF